MTTETYSDLNDINFDDSFDTASPETQVPLHQLTLTAPTLDFAKVYNKGQALSTVIGNVIKEEGMPNVSVLDTSIPAITLLAFENEPDTVYFTLLDLDHVEVGSLLEHMDQIEPAVKAFMEDNAIHGNRYPAIIPVNSSTFDSENMSAILTYVSPANVTSVNVSRISENDDSGTVMLEITPIATVPVSDSIFQQVNQQGYAAEYQEQALPSTRVSITIAPAIVEPSNIANPGAPIAIEVEVIVGIEEDAIKAEHDLKAILSTIAQFDINAEVNRHYNANIGIMEAVRKMQQAQGMPEMPPVITMVMSRLVLRLSGAEGISATRLMFEKNTEVDNYKGISALKLNSFDTIYRQTDSDADAMPLSLLGYSPILMILDKDASNSLVNGFNQPGIGSMLSVFQQVIRNAPGLSAKGSPCMFVELNISELRNQDNLNPVIVNSDTQGVVMPSAFYRTNSTWAPQQVQQQWGQVPYGYQYGYQG